MSDALFERYVDQLPQYLCGTLPIEERFALCAAIAASPELQKELSLAIRLRKALLLAVPSIPQGFPLPCHSEKGPAELIQKALEAYRLSFSALRLATALIP